MYTIVWRLSVIKYNIADFLPDAKISNHAFTVDVRGYSFLYKKARFGAVSPGLSVTFAALYSQNTPHMDWRVNRNRQIP